MYEGDEVDEVVHVDQPVAGLIKDLKARGMLEDTIVIFGGEFGRTIYSQGTLTATNHGRDHHEGQADTFNQTVGLKLSVEPYIAGR